MVYRGDLKSPVIVGSTPTNGTILDAKEIVMAHEFVIYRSVPVVYEDRAGRQYYGDVPVTRYNEITGKFEAVENPRGNAYGARRRQRYRK